VTTKTAWFKLRLSEAELDEWREASRLVRKSLSAYVRRSVVEAIKLDCALRDQAEQEQRQRATAARKN
jgi:hypothetical protein